MSIISIISDLLLSFSIVMTTKHLLSYRSFLHLIKPPFSLLAGRIIWLSLVKFFSSVHGWLRFFCSSRCRVCLKTSSLFFHSPCCPHIITSSYWLQTFSHTHTLVSEIEVHLLLHSSRKCFLTRVCVCARLCASMEALKRMRRMLCSDCQVGFNLFLVLLVFLLQSFRSFVCLEVCCSSYLQT